MWCGYIMIKVDRWERNEGSVDGMGRGCFGYIPWLYFFLVLVFVYMWDFERVAPGGGLLCFFYDSFLLFMTFLGWGLGRERGRYINVLWGEKYCL